MQITLSVKRQIVESPFESNDTDPAQSVFQTNEWMENTYKSKRDWNGAVNIMA